jgi:hypothetical protein
MPALQKKEIAQIAKTFLTILDRENILATTDLETRLGSAYETGTGEDFIEIQKRPSNQGTYAYTLSYTRPNTGIPIEAKLNAQLGYSQIICKLRARLQGYEPFAQDPLGNIVQNKKINSSDIAVFRKELETLSQL